MKKFSFFSIFAWIYTPNVIMHVIIFPAAEKNLSFYVPVILSCSIYLMECNRQLMSWYHKEHCLTHHMTVYLLRFLTIRVECIWKSSTKVAIFRKVLLTHILPLDNLIFNSLKVQLQLWKHPWTILNIFAKTY